jgi:hypothetical protein
VAVALLSLCLGAQQFTDAIYWAGTIAVAGRQASAACGVMNTGGNLAGGVVALAVPLIVERFGWPAALASGSVFALAAAALWLVTATDQVVGETARGPAAAVVAWVSWCVSLYKVPGNTPVTSLRASESSWIPVENSRTTRRPGLVHS